MTPSIEINGDEVVLRCSRGFGRMLLMGALKDADLWARSNASSDLKQTWGRRAAEMRPLLDALPAPANPRDPYEDLPDEPTPEEAAARWRERAASEDARRDAARAVTEKPAEPDLEWSTELEIAAAAGMLEPAIADDLAGLL